MIARIPAIAAALFAIAAAGACRDRADDGAGTAGPRAAAERLLALHGLLGRQPGELTQEERDAPVDREAIEGLVADVGAYDGFTGDLYVGFVVGALARQQGRWTTAMDGARALVAAGEARILFVRRDGAWKVDLGASVPDVVKRRAADEKRRYEAAKAAGRALR
jgi:hypothetical protein